MLTQLLIGLAIAVVVDAIALFGVDAVGHAVAVRSLCGGKVGRIGP